MDKRDDIALVMHCYDLKWARDLNKALSEIFYQPFKIKEESYLPGRSQQMQYEAQLIKNIRSKKINKVFFANYIDDFSNNFIKAGFTKDIYGLLVTSNKQEEDVGGDKRLVYYEKGITPMATQLFSLSDYVSQFFDTKKNPITVGLPLTNYFQEPKLDSDNILFNHRLGKEKGLKELYAMDKKYVDRFFITSPKGSLGDIPKLKKIYKNFQFAVDDLQYKSYINKCGFAVSFNSHETFGVAVHEAIADGLCVLVPNNKTTNYSEMIIDELRFKDLKDFYKKLDNLTKDKKKRKKLILKQQEKSKIFQKKNFQNNILKAIK